MADAFRLTDPALLLGVGITGDDLGDDISGGTGVSGRGLRPRREAWSVPRPPPRLAADALHMLGEPERGPAHGPRGGREPLGQTAEGDQTAWAVAASSPAAVPDQIYLVDSALVPAPTRTPSMARGFPGAPACPTPGPPKDGWRRGPRPPKIGWSSRRLRSGTGRRPPGAPVAERLRAHLHAPRRPA